MQQQIDIPVFNCRCSAIGEIMTEPRGLTNAQKLEAFDVSIKEEQAKVSELKVGSARHIAVIKKIQKLEKERIELLTDFNKPNLSETCKTYLKKWVIEQITKKRVGFKSKQTDKGNAVEDDAITYASIYIPEMGFSIKNEKHFRNEWINGTPDVIEQNFLPDIKSSYTHLTFPLFDNELPEKDYYWQVMGYMALTGIKKGAVLYVLMNMPEDMIEREARYQLGQMFTVDDYEAFAANYRYDDLPEWMRIKRFDVEFDEAQVQAIYTRVEQCREYITSELIPMIEKQQQIFTLKMAA